MTVKNKSTDLFVRAYAVVAAWRGAETARVRGGLRPGICRYRVNVCRRGLSVTPPQCRRLQATNAAQALMGAWRSRAHAFPGRREAASSS